MIAPSKNYFRAKNFVDLSKGIERIGIDCRAGGKALGRYQIVRDYPIGVENSIEAFILANLMETYTRTYCSALLPESPVETVLYNYAFGSGARQVYMHAFDASAPSSERHFIWSTVVSRNLISSWQLFFERSKDN